MTGARIGYLVTPPGLAAIMRTVQEASISCVGMPDQYAAVAAITGDHQHVVDSREAPTVPTSRAALCAAR
jgi:aspartate aminotransferase